MREIKIKNWGGFRRWTEEYSSLARERRGQLMFRGIPGSGWRRNTTLDR